MMPKETTALRNARHIALFVTILFCKSLCVAGAASEVDWQAQRDFFEAMRANDTKTALRLPSANTNLASAFLYGASTRFPLHVAASKGALEIVQALLELGADINAEGDTLDTSNCKLIPLEVAVRYNHPAVVKHLLDAGANVNHMSVPEGSPLHMAFALDQEEIAAWLLDKEANPFLASDHSYQKTAPFELAIMRGHGKLVPRMLLQSRVPTGAPNRGAELLAGGSQPTFTKQAAEFLAARGPAMLEAAVQRGQLEAVEALLAAGVSAKGQAQDRLTLLQTLALATAAARNSSDFQPDRWAELRELLRRAGCEYDAFVATALGDLELPKSRLKVFSRTRLCTGLRHLQKTLPPPLSNSGCGKPPTSSAPIPALHPSNTPGPCWA